MYPLLCHRVIGKTKGFQSILISIICQNSNSLLQASVNLRAAIHCTFCRHFMLSEFRIYTAQLLFYPRRIVIRHQAQSIDEVGPLHQGQAQHIQVAVLQHRFEYRSIMISKPWHFCNWYLVFRHDDRANFGGKFEALSGDRGMDSNTMPYRKLHLLAIDHFQRLSFLLAIVGAQDRSAPKYWCLTTIGSRVDLRLKDPGGIFIGIRLTLGID